MVAKSPFRYAAAPRTIGELLEDAISLWLASWRATLAPALLYGLAGMLPMLGAADLMRRLLRESGSLLLGGALEAPEDALQAFATLLDEVQAWAFAPSTLALALASLLLALLALGMVTQRQHAIAQGAGPRWHQGWGTSLGRAATALAAWIVYLSLMLALLLPLAGFVALISGWTAHLHDSGSLLLLLALFTAGALLLSAPMAWGSVAFGFAPFLAAIESSGPLRAQRESAAQVRGRWLHAAVGVTLPMLAYLGMSSVLSSSVTGAAASVAAGSGGLDALLDGGWWMISAWILLLPGAALLPLASAGVLVTWHDLRLRRSAE